MAIWAKLLSSSEIPQATCESTQSAPFKAGDRTQPGKPITGRDLMFPKNSRFPGSTGMPNLRTWPPAARTAAGAVSLGSDVAELVKMSKSSLFKALSAFAMGSISCSVKITFSRDMPNASSRVLIAEMPFSSLLFALRLTTRLAVFICGGSILIAPAPKAQADCNFSPSTA